MSRSSKPNHRRRAKRLGRELTFRLLYAIDAGGLRVDQAWERCTREGVLLFEGLPLPTGDPITIEADVPAAPPVELPGAEGEVSWGEALAASEEAKATAASAPIEDTEADQAAELARAWIMDFEARRESIDAAITEASARWKLSRMAVIDRNILRLGAFEILSGVTPPRDAIFDCVELAKKYGDTPTPRFVNGILDQLCRNRGIQV